MVSVTGQRAGRTMRMLGSSIATASAAVWIGDFLNAAYFARPAGVRDVADLRLAHTVLSTRWARTGRRVSARDLPAFHRAFGASRARRRWRLDRESLLEGASQLLGDWFPASLADPRRRAHGVVFERVAERVAFDPGRRLDHGALGPLTPPIPRDNRHWSTYPPVQLPNLDAAPAILRRPLAGLRVIVGDLHGNPTRRSARPDVRDPACDHTRRAAPGADPGLCHLLRAASHAGTAA